MTALQLPPAVPATTLRVFEPMEAFPIGHRTVLQTLALREGTDSRADELERAASWQALLAGNGSGPKNVLFGGVVGVRVRRMGGVILFCPVHVEETSRPAGPLDARPPHRLVRAWALPAAWLALVRAEDGVARTGVVGRYLVPMSTARSRAARALRTLRTGAGEIELTTQVEVLARWLEAFHPRSWVELDTSAMLPLTGGEDGADDVRLGLECLAAGDPTGAAAAYHRLASRHRLLDDRSRSS